MGKECLIYGLRDPRTDVILYVGQTTCGMDRPRTHWRPSALEKRENPILANKLRSILALGLKPGIEVLENCNSESELNEAEIYWIAKCREMGYPLTNILEGGTKPPKIEITEEYRQKLRNARKGKRSPTLGMKRTEESKAKMSAIMKGRPGHSHTQEILLKIAKTRSRQFTDESGNLYDSPMDAGLKLNLNPRPIAASIRRGGRLHGYKFSFIDTAVRP